MSFSKFNIEEDNTDVEKAVYAAKYGKWSTTLDIIRKKPYLINCIPEQRSWAVLHQAVYWNNLDIISQLLDIPNCDVLVMTKRSRHNDASPSSTPKEVANQMGGRQAIVDKLDFNVKCVREKRFGGKITFVVPKKEGEKIIDHLPLFMMAVINYRKTLLTSGTCPKSHLVDLLQQIYKEEDHAWPQVNAKLHNAMYGVDKSYADELKTANSEEDFFKKIVYFYTKPQYHTTINNAVSRDFGGMKDKPTSGQDLSVALYDLLLDCVLMCWTGLQKTASTTYRGVPVKVDFNIGSEIMFTHFLSSSLDQEVAKGFCGSNGTLMIIDNTANSIHRPKQLEDMSAFSSEKECLYGIGAEFEVIKIDDSKSYREVHLKLI